MSVLYASRRHVCVYVYKWTEMNHWLEIQWCEFYFAQEKSGIFSQFYSPRQPGWVTKTWLQVVRIKAFQWGWLLLYSFFSAPFSLSLRSISGACLVSKGQMRPRMLQWMLKSERNISLSLSLSQKPWTQEDPFKAWWSASQRQQYVHSWQTEICLDSEYSHPLSKHQLSY